MLGRSEVEQGAAICVEIQGGEGINLCLRERERDLGLTRANEADSLIAVQDTDPQVGPRRAYDVGGWLSRRAKERGHTISVMPPQFLTYFHHYGGRSWSARGKRAALTRWVAGARLARLRALRW